MPASSHPNASTNSNAHTNSNANANHSTASLATHHTAEPVRIFPVAFCEHVLRFDTTYDELLAERLPPDEFRAVLDDLHQQHAAPVQRHQATVRTWTRWTHATAPLAAGFLLTPVLARKVQRLQKALQRFWLHVKADLKRRNRDTFLARGIEWRIVADPGKVVQREAFNHLLAYKLEILFRRAVVQRPRGVSTVSRPVSTRTLPVPAPQQKPLDAIADLDYFVFDSSRPINPADLQDGPSAMPQPIHDAPAPVQEQGPTQESTHEPIQGTTHESPRLPALEPANEPITAPALDTAQQPAPSPRTSTPIDYLAREPMASYVPEDFDVSDLYRHLPATASPAPVALPTIFEPEPLSIVDKDTGADEDTVPAQPVASEPPAPSPPSTMTFAQALEAMQLKQQQAQLDAVPEAPPTQPQAPDNEAFLRRQMQKVERRKSGRGSTHIESIAGYNHVDPYAALYESNDQFVPLTAISESHGPNDDDTACLDVDEGENEWRVKRFRVQPDSQAARFSTVFSVLGAPTEPALRSSAFQSFQSK